MSFQLFKNVMLINLFGLYYLEILNSCYYYITFFLINKIHCHYNKCMSFKRPSCDHASLLFCKLMYLTLCRLSPDINLKGTPDHTMYDQGREYRHHNTTCQH